MWQECREMPRCECCHRRLECIADEGCIYVKENRVLTSTAGKEGFEASFIQENCLVECPKQLFKMKRRWCNG